MRLNLPRYSPGQVSEHFLRLSPSLRRLALVFVDCFSLLIAVWLSFWLQTSYPFHPIFLATAPWLLPSVLLLGLPLYFFTGQYRGLTRYVGSAAFYRLALRNGLLVLLLLLFGAILRLPLPSGTSWVLFWLLITVFTGSVRFTLRDLFLKLRSPKSNNQLRVAIYGAGKAGVQLASALRFAGSHRIVSFIDENPVYWNRTIYGVSIQPPQVLQNLVDSIDQVLLAIPSLSRSERRRIVDHLQSPASLYCKSLR